MRSIRRGYRNLSSNLVWLGEKPFSQSKEWRIKRKAITAAELILKRAPSSGLSLVSLWSLSLKVEKYVCRCVCVYAHACAGTVYVRVCVCAGISRLTGHGRGDAGSDTAFPTANFIAGPGSLYPILEPGRRGAGSARASGLQDINSHNRY